MDAPQTVLKTAGLPSAYVRQGPLKFRRRRSDSRSVRVCMPTVVELAVVLAVIDSVLVAANQLIWKLPHCPEPC